ncbi:MAG: carboxypeptidase M32 [Myxococcota bacterium]
MNEPMKRLRHQLREVADLESIAAVLEWDQNTYMPQGGAEARGRQLAVIQTIAHRQLVSDEMRSLLRQLAPISDRDDEDGALIRKAARKAERARRMPSEFVSELKEHLSRSYVCWTQARKHSDFASVQPFLEKTLELSLRKSEYLGFENHPMDPLVDQWDPGMNVSTVRSLFSELRSELLPLVRKIVDQPRKESSIAGVPFDEERQLAVGRYIAEALGYDFERGRQDLTHHPFMTRLSGGDVRITTRVLPNDLEYSLFSTIHETGHALYEQGIRADFDASPLGEGASAGVHESQSRLWENLVGRSLSFWKRFYPELQTHFPEQLQEVDLDSFYSSINRVEPSLIRTEADEVTYNLHVMLRFELECQMLEGTLRVSDLPEAWNARMSDDFQLKPTEDRLGVLQDVHWYCETIGGLFQGYALGNVMSAQFYYAAIQSEPKVAEGVAEGDFKPLRDWLTAHVYQHGARYEPIELIEKATGKPLAIDDFMTYLLEKFGALYSLERRSP